MRDTYCAFSLEFLFEVYAISNVDVYVCVRAFNQVGQSESDNWNTEVQLPELSPSSIEIPEAFPYERPELSGAVNFIYAPQSEYWRSYPTEEDFLSMPLLSDYSLSEIRYKNEGPVGDLSAIQLAFANGESTPVFDARNKPNEPMQSIAIDQRVSRNLGYVSLQVVYEDVTNPAGAARITGMRLHNKAGLV